MRNLLRALKNAREHRPALLEQLENRQLLSHFHGGFGFTGSPYSGNTIEFSQAPAAVQTGLDALATKDSLTPPASTSTQAVYLANVNGVERYTIDITGTGTNTQLTVDQNGSPVTAPTTSKTTWATLSGTGTGSNAAAAAEISNLATALNLTAPATTTNINVSTAADGVSTYTIRLTPTSGHHATVISVDSNGNPVGDITIPFSGLPTALQTTLNAHVPTGASALTSSSSIQVRTANGVTTYSAVFTSSGTKTTVTINANSQLASLPSYTTTTFQSLPSATSAEIQTLATADGYSGTIASTTSVLAYDEGNGTTVYNIALPVSKTGHSGKTFMVNISISVDQAGNPTTLPTQGDFNQRFDFGDFGGFSSFDSFESGGFGGGYGFGRGFGRRGGFF